MERDDRFMASSSATPAERLRAFRTHAARVQELVQQSHAAAMEAKEQCATLAKEAEELMRDVPSARRAFFNPIRDQAEYLSRVIEGEDEDFSWERPLDESADLVALAEFAVQQAQDKMPTGLELP